MLVGRVAAPAREQLAIETRVEALRALVPQPDDGRLFYALVAIVHVIDGGHVEPVAGELHPRSGDSLLAPLKFRERDALTVLERPRFPADPDRDGRSSGGANAEHPHGLHITSGVSGGP